MKQLIDISSNFSFYLALGFRFLVKKTVSILKNEKN
jgi:hypothetical protein